MHDVFIDKLAESVQELNNARHRRDQNWIIECYEQIVENLEELSEAKSATTALEVENTLIAGEQNGIRKTSGTHKTINVHLKNIARAREADAVQRKNPRKYHTGAFLDHAEKHHKDGTAFDAVRSALADCRKHMKDQITAIGADENEPRRQGNILRHDGLLYAERNYIERQVEHQEKYGSPEEKKLAKEMSLKSFDAKIRREERELEMTPDSPFMLE